jgi:hypothetical protein
MEKLNEIRELMDSIYMDGKKFYEKGFVTAGHRMRKNANTLKRLIPDLRKSVLLEIKKMNGKIDE